MDVHKLNNGGYFVGGQVALSLPGDACMRCMGLITERRLSQEAARYGRAGGMPQVVWTNGVLASVAVNLIIQLFTPWQETDRRSTCIEFDANQNTLTTSHRIGELGPPSCRHFPTNEAGSPSFDIRDLRAATRMPA